MRPLALAVLLFSVPALAEEPVRLAVAKGQPAPFEGVLLSTAEAARIVATCSEAKAERDRLKQAIQEQPAPVGPVVAGVAGLVVGVVVTLALTHR